jgi:DNA invertase Pin-like site-specific DNA recombinase
VETRPPVTLLKDLRHILEKIDAADANFRSLTEAIDSSGLAGRMMMQMLGFLRRIRTRHGARANPRRPEGGAQTGPKRGADAPSSWRSNGPTDARRGPRRGREIAGIFRVNRATISHIAAAARSIPAKAELVT